MSDNNNVLKFRTTTPINNADISGYEDYLKQTLNNPETKNIAISGPYGSGKSSILNTYQNKNNLQEKFHHIQLGTFSTDDDELKNQSDLEKRILNNLRVSIPNQRLIGTSLYSPERISEKDIREISAYVICAIAVFLFIKIFVLTGWGLYLAWWLFALAVLEIVILVFKNISKTKMVSKISFDKIALEMSDEGEKNKRQDYFDNFMTDVVTIFEKLGKQYIVFEDLDRFNNTLIFEKLREINLNINANVNKSTENIVFLYLIKEELFDSEEMSKFFDAVIPVVPVLDKTNAYSHFLQIAQNDFSLDTSMFNQQKLSDILSFVNDMRLLIYVLNDFVLYKHLFKRDKLSETKLLGILLYKHLFPKDFTLLQKKQGVAFEIISKKEKFRNEYMKDVEKQVLTNSSPDIEYPQLENELDAIKVLSFQEIMMNVPTSKLESIINNHNITDTSKVAENKREAQKQIQNSEYKEAFVVLLKEGFIDDTYNDYVSIFIPGELTRNDFDFVRLAIAAKQTDFSDYKLDNPEKVLARLGAERIFNSKVLNNQLVDVAQTEHVIKQFVKAARKEEAHFFILQSIFDARKNQAKIMRIAHLVYEEWLLFWNLVVNSEFELSEIKDEDLFSLIWLFAFQAKEQNVENNYSQFKHQLFNLDMVRFLKMPSFKNESIEIFDLFNIKFSIMSEGVSSSDANNLLKRQMIVLNDETMHYLNESFNSPLNMDDLAQYPVSKLKNQQNDFSKHLLGTYFIEYVEWILQNNELAVENSLIVKEFCDFPGIENVLSRLSFSSKIELLSDWPSALWNQLFEGKNVTLNAKNVFIYLKDTNNSLSNIVKHLNEIDSNKFDVLDEDIRDEMLTKEQRNILFDDIANSTSLNDDICIKLIESLGLVYRDGYAEKWNEFDDERLSKFIQAKVIVLDETNVQQTINNTPKAMFAYGLDDENKFLQILKNINVDGNFDQEINQLFEYEIAQYKDFEYIIEIAKLVKKGISINNGLQKKYRNEIIKQNAIFEDVVDYIGTQKHIGCDKSTALSFESFFKKNLEKARRRDYKFKDKAFVIYFINNVTIDIDIRKQIFAANIEKFTIEQIKEYLKKVNLEELLPAFQGKRPLIIKNKTNIWIADGLEEMEIISSSKIEGNNIRLRGRLSMFRKP